MDDETGIGMGSGGDVDVDALMSSIDQNDSHDFEMTSPPVQEASKATEQTTAPTEFVLNAKGEQIKVPANDPRVSKWLQQGRDYAQNMESFNTQKAEWEKKVAEAERYKSTYSPIDEWATQNPQQWEKFQQSFSQFQQNPDSMGLQQPGLNAPGSNDPIMQEIQALKEQVNAQLQPVAKSVSDLIQERESAKARDEDKRLEEQIKSLQGQYKDADWQTPDAEGKTLEMRVLEHADKKNIGDFNIAFRDFYHDNLIKQAETRGRESQMNELQKRTRLGLLGETPAPTKSLSEARNIKSKSYDDLTQEALDEMGIG